MLVWHFAFFPVAREMNVAPSSAFFAAFPPVGDLALVFVMAAVMLRGPRYASQWALAIGALSLILMFVGDVVSGVEELRGDYVAGGLSGVVYGFAWLGLAAATYLQSLHKPSTRAGTRPDGLSRRIRLAAIRRRVPCLRRAAALPLERRGDARTACPGHGHPHGPPRGPAPGDRASERQPGRGRANPPRGCRRAGGRGHHDDGRILADHLRQLGSCPHAGLRGSGDAWQRPGARPQRLQPGSGGRDDDRRRSRRGLARQVQPAATGRNRDRAGRRGRAPQRRDRRLGLGPGGARHHPGTGPRGAAGPNAAHGGRRPARRRNCSRFQQHPDGHKRLLRARGRLASGWTTRPQPTSEKSSRLPTERRV